MTRRVFLYSMAVFCCLSAVSQEQQGVHLSGSIQSEMLIPSDDFLTNTYADLMLQSKYADAGLRMEYMEHPLPGFEKDFAGWGVPHFWVKGKLGETTEITVGTFYEQFGSGFILRTYEERSLGIDNSLLGGRVVVKPLEGVTLKALAGKQRRYWNWNKSLVSGLDAELALEEFVPSIQQNNSHLTLGASWVNKYEDCDEKIYVSPVYRVHFPKFVNAWDIRISLNHGPWSVMGEYAEKGADPSFANTYIFKKGTAAMVSGSFSQKGLSVLLQAKRSENMSFKSTNDLDKTMGNSSMINHLPAFTQDHTYTWLFIPMPPNWLMASGPIRRNWVTILSAGHRLAVVTA